MSTPFVFSDELPELYTVAPTDIVMLWDTSTGLMKRATVSAVKTIVAPASGPEIMVAWLAGTQVRFATRTGGAWSAAANTRSPLPACVD